MSPVGDGIISSVYAVPLVVGAAQQNYPLQLDTGSSDSVRIHMFMPHLPR